MDMEQWNAGEIEEQNNPHQTTPQNISQSRFLNFLRHPSLISIFTHGLKPWKCHKNPSSLTCGGKPAPFFGVDAQWVFPGIDDKYLSRQTSSWEAKTTLGWGMSLPSTHIQAAPQQSSTDPEQDGGLGGRGMEVTEDGGSGDRGEGLTLLPVSCHPALDCLEFRLQHVWGQ